MTDGSEMHVSKFFRRLLKRPSPTTVIASAALLLALGGTSIAAVNAVLPKGSVGNVQLRRDAVTSDKVKNGSLLKVDFKSGEIPAGTSGPAGPAGAQGPPGPSDAYFTEFNGSIPLPIGSLYFSRGSLVRLRLPQAGNYVIVAKAVFTNQSGLANVFCELTTETPKDGDTSGVTLPATVAETALATTTATLTNTFVHASTAADKVSFQCVVENSANVWANHIKITAIRVANLTNTGF